MSHSPRTLEVAIEKRLGDFCLQVQLEAEPGILVLFGPSGAGKTLTLHTISGLAVPDAGHITLGETVFFAGEKGERPSRFLPPRARQVGHVFQGYALFPHLTVLENVAFSRWPKRERLAEATRLLESMQLGHLATRLPHEISGGQAQRVAIARALAARPRVLLLDEPFSAVDAAVRERLQRDLVALQRERQLIIIYVTHDLEDAFAIGDHLAVFGDGRLTQIGPIAEVLHQPTDQATALALGVRNLFAARIQNVTTETLVLDWAGLQLEAPPRAAEVGAQVNAYIRPEAIKLIYPDKPLVEAVTHNRLRAAVLDHRLEGALRAVRLRLANGGELLARFPVHAYLTVDLTVGREVELSVKPNGIVLLGAP